MNVDEVLEKVSADCFWAPDHVSVVERPSVKYIHSPNPAGIYNRVLKVRPDEIDLEAFFDEVLDAHRGKASMWTITTLSDTPELREMLEAAGYEAGHLTHAYSMETDAYDREVEHVDVREVSSLEDLQVLYEINASVFDRAIDKPEEQLQRELSQCTGADRRIARFVAYLDGEPAGTGGMTFFDDEDFALIWAAGVREEHRGRRVYTALLAERARVAAERGIARMGLYARATTSAPIVAAHGFERHGDMRYYERGIRSES